MLNIVLFGPPGAGKGTQAEKLISKYNLIHLSTGNILRGEIEAGTNLGLEAKKLMDAGILVPDEVVIGMISSKLDHHKDAKGFIFDGFPRTAAQAEALDKLLAEKDTAIDLMLALEVSDEELTKRLLLRGAESGRPDDQNEDIIRNRIKEYNNKTAPLKSYYTAQNKFRSIHGIGGIDDISAALYAAIKAGNKPVVSKKPAGKKIPPEKKAIKKAPPKAAKKATAKKAVKKTVKKATPKKAKKTIAKKVVKKAAKKAAKKVAKKPVKKTTVKKINKPGKKKSAKKAAAKKTSKTQKTKKAGSKNKNKKSNIKRAVKRPLKKQVKKNSKKRK